MLKNDNQARDDHGRFASGSGSSSASTDKGSGHEGGQSHSGGATESQAGDSKEMKAARRDLKRNDEAHEYVEQDMINRYGVTSAEAKQLVNEVQAPFKSKAAGLDPQLSKGESPVKKMKMFIPLTKIDEEQRLVYGIATCEKKDRSGEICDYETSKPFYEKWSGEIAKASGGKSLGNIRAMHSKVAAGKVVQLVCNDDAKQIEVCGKVVDDAEWNKVKEGVYTGFSHGGSYEKVWKDADGTVRYTANPVELSLVDIPCLPDATFTTIKSDGAQELRKFATVVVEPSLTQVGMKADALAKAAGEGHVWSEFADAALEALLQEQIDAAFEKATKADDAEEEKDEPKDDKGEEDAEDKKDKKKKTKKSLEPQQVWKCNHADHNHLAKAEAVSCMKDDEANELAKEVVAPVNDALEKLKKALAPKIDVVGEFVKSWKTGDTIPNEMALEMAKAIKEDGELAEHLKDFDIEKADAATIMAKLQDFFAKRDFSKEERKAAAKSGAAMSDGSYPIEDKKDLENAIEAYGRASNKAAVKRHIKQRAKALGAEDMLPDNWKMAGGELKKHLEKGLWQVGRLANIIQDLEWLKCDVQYEAANEGDGSTIGDELKQDIASLCERLKALVAEETAELFEDEDEVIIEVVEAFADTDSLVKVLGERTPEQLKKLEKRVSPLEVLAAKFEKMRDALPDTATGARGQFEKCAGMAREMCKAGARHSKKDVEMIQQMHDLASELGADCGDNSTEKVGEAGALRKQLNDLVPQIDRLTKQVEELRAQPAPAKAVTRLLGKTEDVEAQQGDAVTKLATELDKMSADERAAALMKLALRNGVQLSK